MIKISLAIPRDNERMVVDLFHLNGFKYELVRRHEEPSLIVVEVDEASMEKFNPRESLVPIATA